jgi:hypothetical protein
MSASIQPDELAKYAPRWMREGTGRPRYGTTFPTDVQVPVDPADEPPWRGPSPFDGDVRRWRAEQPSEEHGDAVDEQHVTGHEVVLVNTTMHLPGTRRSKLLQTAAIASLIVVSVGAVAVFFFPSAGSDSHAALTVAKSQGDAYTIRSISVVAKSTPGDAAPRTPDDSGGAERTLDEVANAMYVVPSVDPAPALTPQSPLQVEPATLAPASKETTIPAHQAQPQDVGSQTTSSPVPQKAPVVQPVVRVSQDEIDRLIKRGESFLAEGDVVAARAFLERAAGAGDARAALALGSTYDPNVLKNMGTFGIRPDPEQAHRWYERAAEFGSKEASQRITALAQLGR